MCQALPGLRQQSRHSAAPSGHSWALQGPEHQPGADLRSLGAGVVPIARVVGLGAVPTSNSGFCP